MGRVIGDLLARSTRERTSCGALAGLVAVSVAAVVSGRRIVISGLLGGWVRGGPWAGLPYEEQ